MHTALSAYDTRIADRFLESRAQLGAALVSLTALADESLATMPAAARLRAVQAHLRRPFVFLAVGEADAGKSTLLNALFGREFSDPDEHRTCIFRYGDEPADTPLTASLVERARPLPFLRDFQLVDTAGASDILSDHEARIEELAPSADLIIFVVSALDPWSASAWDLIEAVHEKWSKPIVVAVQHADERSEREVAAICHHASRTAAARFRREPPVFAVSARKALLARTNGIDRDRLWRESGFGPLEACIDEIVGGAHGRGADLPAAASEGRAVLRDIAAEVRRQAQDVRGELATITAVDQLITSEQNTCDALVDALRLQMEAAATRCRRQGENLLRVRARGWHWQQLVGLHDNRRWARAFQRKLATMLRSAVTREAEATLNAMISRFQAAADGLFNAYAQPSDGDAGRYEVAAEAVGTRCEALVEEVELTLAEHTAQDTIETRVQKGLTNSVRSLRWAVGSAVGGAVTAIAAGFAAGPFAALGAVTVAMLAAAGFAMRARAERQSAIASYLAEAPGMHAALIGAVDASFRATAAACCAQLHDVLTPMSAHCARRDERVRPIHEQVESIESALTRIAVGR